MNEPYGASGMTLRSRRVGVNGTSIPEVFYAPYGPPPNVAYGSLVHSNSRCDRTIGSLMVLASVRIVEERECSKSKRPGSKLPFDAVRANVPVSPRSA